MEPDSTSEAYATIMTGAIMPFSKDEWARLARDGIWVAGEGCVIKAHLAVQPNWTTEPGKNRWGDGSVAQDDESLQHQYDEMHAFIRERAAAGDELYERLLGFVISQRLKETRNEI